MYQVDGGKLSRIKSIKRSVENGTTYYRFESHRAVSLRPEYALKRYEELQVSIKHSH